MAKDKDQTLDLDFHKSQYLGGDDDKFEGILDSDDDIDFDTYKKKSNSNQA
jgi:hypothetical protein